MCADETGTLWLLEEMIGVGEWHQRTVETAINLNRGYLAFKRGNRGEMLK